jgi:hypothetical protein
LELIVDGVRHVVRGHLELGLMPTTTFAARVTGSGISLHFTPTVAVPAGSSLDPPSTSVLPRSGSSTWSDPPIPLLRLEAGDASDAERFLIHISGPFRAHLPMGETDSGPQNRLSFSLPGWDLVLAPVDERRGDNDFVFVVEAVPTRPPAAMERVRELHRRLFTLVSLIAGQEVGIGPICGMNVENKVVWAELGQSRRHHRPHGVRWWCNDRLVSDALPVLSQGFGQFADDPGFESVVRRAIAFLLSAAGSDEVLDVRIPVACAGLELLGWAILQRKGWLGVDALNELSAGAVCRLVLQWAGVPVAIPNEFGALAARKGRIGQRDWAGPEVLFNVRNKLVHPPKRLDEPEWPAPDELDQSWQLATWYLALVVLRVLGYDGRYQSPWYEDAQPVPWVPTIRASAT